MRSEQDIKRQVTAVRDRVKELSGFWLGEGAAMLYVLEWVLEKRETAPAGELGRAGGDSETIAGNLAKLAEKAAESSRPRPVAPVGKTGPVAVPAPPEREEKSPRAEKPVGPAKAARDPKPGRKTDPGRGTKRKTKR